MSKSQPIESNNVLNVEKGHTSFPDVHQFNHAQYWGYGLVIITYTIAEYAQEWESLKYFMHPALETNKMLFIFRLILFIEIVILIGRWFIATINEVDMWSSLKLNWSHWANSFFSKQNTYTGLIGISALVGLLLALVGNIFAMSSILSLYLLFNYWTQWLCNKYFNQAVNATKSINTKHKKSIEIMKHYWLIRPQLARIVTMMFFSLVSVSLATASTFQSEYKDFFEESAYILVILVILVSEIVIAMWRYKRDSDLEKITNG